LRSRSITAILHDQPKSGRKALATTRTTRRNHLHTTIGGHAGAEAMTTLADKFAWLISPFHGYSPDIEFAFLQEKSLRPPIAMGSED
jgi:single-stranded DNA-specific DHH superfamily exonuclease